MNGFRDLVQRTRSYRRFDESHAIPLALLRDVVELTRYCPSGANLQPLKFILSVDPATNAAIFPTLAWAAYLKDWPGPEPGERPSGYIVVLHDGAIVPEARGTDALAAYALLLGAAEQGLGGCLIASIRKDELRRVLGIADRYTIQWVVALGRPKERVLIDDLEPGGDHRYWRDEAGVHHVPKRRLDELLVASYG